jgi:hypothetical protein
MEVDLLVSLEPQLFESKVIFDIKIFSSTTNGFDEAEGVALLPSTTLAEATTHCNGTTNPTLSNMIAKEE